MKNALLLPFLLGLSPLMAQAGGTPSPHNYSIEIPEVQELIFIICAITEEGIRDSVMINHNTKYYQKVRAHFGPFRNEKVVKHFGKHLAQNYYHLRMDGSNYSFDDDGKLLRDASHNNLSWGNRDQLKKHLSSLEDFSKKTGFREFYKNNASHYDSLRSLLDSHVPVNQVTAWLEHAFPARYDHLRIVFSPLSLGKHSTVKRGNHIIIWVSGPTENSPLTKTLLEARDTRMLFTEIDHNYVNPISDLYLRPIRQSFGDRQKWADNVRASGYTNEYAVFNEYMTWSVFLLYALDTYSPEDFASIKANIVDFMVSRRGFFRFQDFNEKLIELYEKKGPSQLISDLYPEILAWCRAQ